MAGNSDFSSSDSETEWLEVEPNANEASLLSGLPSAEPTAPSTQPLQIDITQDQDGKKRKKPNFYERAMATYRKELRVSTHKAHLVCLVAHGQVFSGQCDNPHLQALLLSLTPPLFAATELSHLRSEKSLLSLLRWFHSALEDLDRSIVSTLKQRLSSVQLLVALLRSLSLRARLVLALNPHPLKDQVPQTTRKLKAPKSKNKETTEAFNTSPTSTASLPPPSPAQPSPPPPPPPPPSSAQSAGFSNALSHYHYESPSKRHSTSPHFKSTDTLSMSNSRGRKRKIKSEPSNVTPSRTNRPKRSCTLKKGTVESANTDDSSAKEKRNGSSSDEYVPMIEETNDNKRRSRKRLSGKLARLSQKARSRRSVTSQSQESTESDEEEDDSHKSLKEETKTSDSKCVQESISGHKMMSSEEPIDNEANKGTSTVISSQVTQDSDSYMKEDTVSQEAVNTDHNLYDDTSSWAEVYTNEDKWRCLHLPSLSIGQPHLCEKHSTVQLHYVLAVENGHRMRDVTARYAYKWCSLVHKARVDEEWWAETMRPYSSHIAEQEKEERDITSQLLSYPMPVSAQEFKNHPLYALKKHLLKFEAIYPPDTEPLSYFRGEPVYSRDCVHLLHTRETWLKEGIVVKKGERPYNIVKARKKRGQSSHEAQNSTTEVFGKWQTEEYIPPPVVDGQVPRNEYGNVELFKPSMLPPGGAHMTVPGIQRVARKLEIDFAPAMMGWDFHGGYCHPIINGIVVAKEWEGILLEAWQQERELIDEKQQQKRDKRVTWNWMKLTRGLLIRERVRKRFALDHSDMITDETRGTEQEQLSIN